MSGGEWLVCQLVKQLLAEKLIDDFYEEYESVGKQGNTENFMEQLRMVLPVEQHGLLERLEASYAERCGEELRQFADFVAGILITVHRDEEDGGG